MVNRKVLRGRAMVPVEPSTHSFWHNQRGTTLPDCSKYVHFSCALNTYDCRASDIRNSSDLPPRADYVIIGSGLSGSLIAYDLVQTLPKGTKIVILEARFPVSGATGRNGGHIKPGRIHSFAWWEQVHGTDIAVKQVALEKANYEETVKFIKQEGLVEEVDLVELRAVDVCMNDTALAKIKTCWERLSRTGVDTSDMEFQQGPTATDVSMLVSSVTIHIAKQRKSHSGYQVAL
jgi:L-2-hydroxyglutarate oxidase LhgO